MLQRVKQAVSNVGGTILGVVLNNVDIRHDQHYEYYTSYYNYYHKTGKNDRRKGSKKRKTQTTVAASQTKNDTDDEVY